MATKFGGFTYIRPLLSQGFALFFAHPGCGALVHALLESGAEGAVAMVSALLCQFLGDDGFLCSGKFAVAGYEMTDAKVVDVFIIACVLTGEILAEIVVLPASKNFTRVKSSVESSQRIE